MASSTKAPNASIALSSLFKQLNLDPKPNGDTYIETLCSNMLKGTDGTAESNNEAMKWIKFAKSFPVDSKSRFESLNGLNEHLSVKSVLLGTGLTPSKADIVVYAALHSFLISISGLERQKVPHVMRWMDYIQNQVDMEGSFEKILVEKSAFEPPKPKIVSKVETESNLKSTEKNQKKTETSEADSNSKKSEAVKKEPVNKEASQEKKKHPVKETVEKEVEVSVSLLNIQVGIILKAWKHPSADSLLVEEIDVGGPKPRQVVSGLAKYYSPEDLTNRQVVLITNVKAGKLRDVVSEGLVLCASNEDHSVVEPLLPPEGAKVGERVSFAGNDGTPETVLNPKKKQLEKITLHLFTDDKGVAMYKNIPFMTSAGPCRSSIPKATIK